MYAFSMKTMSVFGYFDVDSRPKRIKMVLLVWFGPTEEESIITACTSLLRPRRN